MRNTYHKITENPPPYMNSLLYGTLYTIAGILLYGIYRLVKWIVEKKKKKSTQIELQKLKPKDKAKKKKSQDRHTVKKIKHMTMHELERALLN